MSTKTKNDYTVSDDIIKEISDDVYACASCGYCRFGCPVFQQLGFDRITPRGRMIALKRAIEGRGDVPQTIIDSIYTCAQCENCKIQCPLEIDFVKISELLREDMAKQGVIPEAQEVLRDRVVQNSNPFGEPKDERGAWQGPNLKLEKGVPNLFFVGCAVSYASNRIAKSIVRVLDMTGYRYNILGQDENCCGAPLFRVGEREKALELVEKNTKLFDDLGTKTIFATCAGCYKTIKKLYPDRFKVLHITQLLLELIKSGEITFKKELNKKIIYFDGCDIGRHTETYEEPREMLKSIPGVELLEYDYNREQAICCGGPLLSMDPDLAASIAADRVREAIEKGADMIVTPCPTCMVNLKAGARAQKLRMDIQDIPMLLPSIVAKKDA